MSDGIGSAHEFFGEALAAFAAGDRAPFYLTDETGYKSTYSLVSRFRPPSRLNSTERRLVAEARGRIIDVGTGSGNVLPALARRGDVLGIDISPKAIEVARRRGFPCLVADILTFEPDAPFDTVTFFGNSLGMGATLSGTTALLGKLVSILAPNGQVLANVRKLDAKPYREIRLTPSWQGRTGPEFGWLISEIGFLTDLARAEGFDVEILSESWKYRLIRLQPAQ